MYILFQRSVLASINAVLFFSGITQRIGNVKSILVASMMSREALA